MEIFNDIKSKVSETAKTAIKKSNEMVEVTKLNFSIGEIQTQMDRVLKDIGKIIYDAYKEGDLFSEQITIKCAEVDEKAEEISEIKHKLQKLKKVKPCPNCQKENELEASFCSRCGYQIETEEADEY